MSLWLVANKEQTAFPRWFRLKETPLLPYILLVHKGLTHNLHFIFLPISSLCHTIHHVSTIIMKVQRMFSVSNTTQKLSLPNPDNCCRICMKALSHFTSREHATQKDSFFIPSMTSILQCINRTIIKLLSWSPWPWWQGQKDHRSKHPRVHCCRS